MEIWDIAFVTADLEEQVNSSKIEPSIIGMIERAAKRRIDFLNCSRARGCSLRELGAKNCDGKFTH